MPDAKHLGNETKLPAAGIEFHIKTTYTDFIVSLSAKGKDTPCTPITTR
jgi:hypothetical protein